MLCTHFRFVVHKKIPLMMFFTRGIVWLDVQRLSYYAAALVAY